MIRNPIDPAVTDIAEHHQVSFYNSRGESARSGVLAVRRCAPRSPRHWPTLPPRPQRLRSQPPGWPAYRVPLACAPPERRAPYEQPPNWRHLSQRRRHPVAHHQHRARAGCRLGRDSRRILVAVMPTPGRSTRQPMMPVARCSGLLRRALVPCGLAVTVCPDDAAVGTGTGNDKVACPSVLRDRVISIGAAMASDGPADPTAVGVRAPLQASQNALLSCHLCATVRQRRPPSAQTYRRSPQQPASGGQSSHSPPSHGVGLTTSR